MYVTVSSDEDENMLLDCGIPKSRVFVVPSGLSRTQMQRITGGRHFSVVLNATQDESHRFANCTEAGGFYIEISDGSLSGKEVTVNRLPRSATFSSIDIVDIYRQNRNRVSG